MRTLLVLVAASVVLRAQQPARRQMPQVNAGTQQQVEATRPEDRCTVEGAVFNAQTGEPLKKATVTLRRAGGGPGGFISGGVMGSGGPGGPGGGTYTGTTDAGGSYRISNVEPGRYRVSVERTGFVDQVYGAKAAGLSAGTILTLEKASSARDISVRMTPQGVIAGKVMDEDGEGVQGATVQVMRRGYVRGRKQLLPVENAGTNDLGEYRVYGLAPGKYVISATYRRNGGGGSRGPQTQDSDAEAFATTYYPSGANAEMASPLEVQPGSQFRGIDVRLRKTRIVRIAGRVSGIPANPGRGPGVSLQLIPKDASANFAMRNAGRVIDGDGNFLISNVAPGSYVLTAIAFDNGRNLFARMPLEVGNSPIENLGIQLAPGSDLRGRVKVDGSDAAPTGVRILMTARGGAMFAQGGGPMASAVAADGTFTVSNVQPEVYDLRVTGVPDGGYVRSVRVGNADVTESAMDFTTGPVAGEIAVTIATTAAAVDGTVQNDRSEAAGNAVVVLVPEGARREFDRFYMSTSTDASGKFTFKNIAPGEYRVYAFDNVESNAYMDPEWLAPYESRGERVSLKDGSHETVSVKLTVVQGL